MKNLLLACQACLPVDTRLCGNRLDRLEETVLQSVSSRLLQVPAEIGTSQFHLRHLDGLSVGVAVGFSGMAFEVANVAPFLQIFPLSGSALMGSGAQGEVIRPGQSFLTAPDMPHRKIYSDDYGHILLTVREETVRDKLEALLGVAVPGALGAGAGRVSETSSHSELIRAVGRLLCLPEPKNNQSALIYQAELQQYILLNFIFANRHLWEDYFARAEAHASNRQLATAVGFIEANWNRPILVEDIAAAAGASARSVFRAFRQRFGCTPMQYLKTLRLRHARDLLRTGPPSLTVTEVIYACGFASIGHFSGDYKRAFGELPGETLSRAR